MNRRKRENKTIWLHIVVFIVFLAVSFVMNWSLLTGENLMKWDIWDAEYPSQVLMSEALANHTLPLWNPLMRYGTPNYAVLGTPVWYVITLILAWIGYTPVTVAVSYALHIAIGGFGMYLLAGQELKKEHTLSEEGYWASFLAGLLYCGSGIFLSNAQHIMIIISAAWIPYVFLLMRSYLEKKHIVSALGAGLCAAQLLLGGYPEMFFDLFLFLIPYTLYFGYRKDITFIKNVLACAGKYLAVCIGTVCAGAMILLPFLCNMGLITRGNGLGQTPNGYSPATFLSVLFPQMTRFITGNEPSMINYYVGLVTILLIPMILVMKQQNKKMYLCLAATALLLCMGENSFLHALLYRFCPMYASFRFPTLNRAFIAVFVLLTLAPVLQEILDSGEISRKVLQLLAVLAALILAAGGITAIITSIHNVDAMQDTKVIKAFSESALRLGVILIGYFILFYAIYKKQITKIWRKGLVIGLVAVEVFSWSYWETPITIARYQQGEYSRNQKTKDAIDKEFTKYNKRQHGENFAGHSRSTSGLNSKNIVFHQTFDEEGYCSFLLSATAEFGATYFRNIIEQNPEVYFTNHVITPEDMPYEEWVNRADNTPEQIYVEQGLEERVTSYQMLNAPVTEENALNLASTEQGFAIDGTMSAGKNKTGRVRIYWSTMSTDTIPMELTFTDSDGAQQTISGEYHLTEQENGCYAEVYFPSVEKEYQQIQVTTQAGLPTDIRLVETERMTSDGIVDVSWFGFNSIQMTVEAPTEGYVTVLQSKYKGWKAYVDGEEEEISLINNCFMGVHVSEGQHTILMKFRPMEWFVGAAITACYDLLVVVMLLLYRKKKCMGRMSIED